MSSVMQILLWSPVQVSILACAVLGVGSLLGRRRPAAGASVAAAALLAVAGLTATAFSPWPAWHLGWENLPWSHLANSHDQQAKPAGREMPNRFAQSRPMTSLWTLTRSPAIRPARRLSRRFRRRDSGRHWPTIGLDSSPRFTSSASPAWPCESHSDWRPSSYRRNSHPVTDRRLGELADVVPHSSVA